MTERGAIGWAAVGHLLLLALLSLGLARAWAPSRDIADVTPVEFVDIGAATTVTERTPPPPEAAPREVGTPTPAEELVPDPAPPVPTPPVESVARQVADTTAQDAIAAEVAATPPPRTRPAPSPPARREFDAGQLAALIDKALPEGPRQPRALNAARDGKASADAPISAIQMATLQQAIRGQIAPCWNPPVGGADVADMTVVLTIRLNRDGSVAGTPQLVSQTGATDGNSAYARAFVEAARRAVLRCAPLQLPADLYRHWAAFELNFDPKLMT